MDKDDLINEFVENTMFKNLVWTKVEHRDECCYIAESPARKTEFVINYEEGKYWAAWDAIIPGTENIAELKVAAEKLHQDFFNNWLK